MSASAFLLDLQNYIREVTDSYYNYAVSMPKEQRPEFYSRHAVEIERRGGRVTIEGDFEQICQAVTTAVVHARKNELKEQFEFGKEPVLLDEFGDPIVKKKKATRKGRK